MLRLVYSYYSIAILSFIHNLIIHVKVSVNEAAAQLCLLMPSLLNRRDELFPLARQVVRNSGYQYSKGHSRSQFCQTGFPSKLFGTNVNIKPDKMNSGSSGDTESGESGKEEGGSEDGKKDRRSSDTDNSDQRKRHRTTSVENEELIQRRKVIRYKILRIDVSIYSK